jgi:hypothetical protein
MKHEQNPTDNVPANATELAQSLTDVRETRNYIRGVRADGLTVFLDKTNESDEDFQLLSMLNQIRIHGTHDQVVTAVAMVRAIQIARSYARKYAPAVEKNLTHTLKAIGSQAIRACASKANNAELKLNTHEQEG